jgi:hypothetical protein
MLFFPNSPNLEWISQQMSLHVTLAESGCPLPYNTPHFFKGLEPLTKSVASQSSEYKGMLVSEYQKDVLQPCTFRSFPVPFRPFTAHSVCGLLYGCYIPTNILLRPASSVDAQPLGFSQWRSSECSPKQTYDLCNYASLLLFLLSFAIRIVFNILLSTLELSPYLV